MTTETPQSTPPAPAPEENKYVPKDAHEKLMAEKKNWADKAKTLEQELETFKLNILKEKDDQKGINEILLKENQTLKSKLTEREEAETKAIKYTKIKQEWQKLGLKDSEPADAMLELVKIDAVKYDPELRVVLGAEEEAKRIFEKFQPMFKTFGNKPNHDAPQGTPSEVSIESYRQMLADGSFNKMTPAQQKEYQSKLYASRGIELKK